jgi:hypothetical protein
MRKKTPVAVPRKASCSKQLNLSGDKFFALNRERATTETFEDIAGGGSANRPRGAIEVDSPYPLLRLTRNTVLAETRDMQSFH